MSNKKGSMMHEYGEVTGSDFINQTAIRRTLEPKIQTNEIMKTRSKAIAQHTVGVGQKYYDTTAPAFRGVSLHLINEAEGTNRLIHEDEDVPDDIAAKRLKLDESDKAANLVNAQKVLEENAMKVVKRKKAGNKMDSDDRNYLQNAFASGGDFEGFFNSFSKFPGR